jgi:Domain of unknown function (DUF1905)
VYAILHTHKLSKKLKAKKMNYLIKDEQIELKHQPGKGAWTYHIEIPNTKHIIGKWGFLKASGTIDGYKIEAKNLFTINGKNKLLSVNQTIRDAINKSGGDMVTVTLYLLGANERVTEAQILETFKDSGVLKRFQKLSNDEQTNILTDIIAQKTDEKQVKNIIEHIDKLSQ